MKRNAVMVISLAWILVLLTSCLLDGPGRTVEKLYRAIEEGQTEKAVAFFSKQVVDSIGADKLRAALQEGTREIDRKGGIKIFKIVEEKEIGEVAEVAIEIEYGTGEKETETIELVMEEGKWKVQVSK